MVSATNSDIEVTLSGRVYRTNLFEELCIDNNDIRKEVINQPAKFAWWSTIHHLLGLKKIQKRDALTQLQTELDKQYSGDTARMISDPRYARNLEEYLETCKHLMIVEKTKETLTYRKSALLELWSNPTRTEVLDEYNSKVRALTVANWLCFAQ